MGLVINMLLLTLFIQILVVRAQNEPEVTLSTGRVLGQKLVSAANRLYYSFKGIPYTAPPVGNLRFKAPQPPEKWNGTLKAFDIPPACSQPWKQFKYPERFSEDCLFVNVFTPHLQPPRGTLMPVMVWIHGGKYYQDSSTLYLYGADFFITEDVVLVTFNYRLGAFGYLNMNTKSAQGNAGQKDKIAALKWVKKEIQHFGGNPNLVTIFGGSSGAADVHSLYLSPMAKGLFQRAISESCTVCGSNHNFSFNPGVKLADLVGCPSTDMEAAVACLRSLPAQFLAEKQMAIFNHTEEGLGSFSSDFLPTIEEFHGEEIFMPNYLDELMESSTSKIPYMIGMNSGEGRMFLTKNRSIIFHDLDSNFMSYFPSFMQQNVEPEVLNSFEKKLKEVYFGGSPISNENVEALVALLTDMTITVYLRRIAKSIASHAPVYLYYFAFKGEFETQFRPDDQLNLTTVGHGGELGYLFYRNAVEPNQNHLADFQRECVTLTRMVRLWTNFAKYGNPTPNVIDSLLSESWLPVNGSLTQYLIINDSLHMEHRNLLADRMAVWDTFDSFSNLDPADEESQVSIALYILLFITFIALIMFIYLFCNSICKKGGGYTSI